MVRNKLQRFEENARMPHVVQASFEELLRPTPYPLRNGWQQFFPAGTGPLVLELGCGGGEYTLALARLHPEKRFIGVDKKGARLWKGARQSLDEGLPNVAFLRTQIHLIDRVFGPDDCVEEIWLPFPDPQPRKARAHRRLTHPRYLDLYRSFALPHARVHLKTDNEILMNFTLEMVHAQGLPLEEYIADVHQELPADHLLRTIITKYERMFLEEGRTIRYCRFRLSPGS